MNSDNKQIRDVADVAARIMAGLPPLEEKLHPNQQKLDVHEPEKDELTADDFKKLRAGKKADVKKEEVEQQDEAMSHQAATTMKHIPNASPALKQAAKDIKPGVGGYRDRVAMLKAGGVKEEVEQIDELSKDTLNSYVKKSFSDKEKDNLNTTQRQKGLRKATSRLYKEGEQIDEVKMADLPSTKVQGRAYGASKPEPHPLDVMKGPSKSTLDSMAKQKKEKKFSEMVDTYKNNGLKSFLETLEKEEEVIDEVSKDIADYTMDVIDAGEYTEVTIGEEASQEEFNTEIKKAQAKSEGKDKAEVAKGSVQAVKQEETEITDEMIFEVLENAGIDFESLSDDELQKVANEAHDILSKQIDERHMTEPEMKKREKIVKSMKKGLSGFKERYGARAKNVMYATATKQAMKEETESEHYKAGHEYASDHAQDAGFKVTARARKKEMLADNPHKKGTPEHSDWHRGANDGHQTALDNM